MKMRHEKALDIGLARAEMAAEALRRWTGVRAIAVCAVQTVPETGLRAGESWEPVGPFSYKEIARDDGMTGGGNYHLLIVDENWTAKASCPSQWPRRARGSFGRPCLRGRIERMSPIEPNIRMCEYERLGRTVSGYSRHFRRPCTVWTDACCW